MGGGVKGIRALQVPARRFQSVLKEKDGEKTFRTAWPSFPWRLEDPRHGGCWQATEGWRRLQGHMAEGSSFSELLALCELGHLLALVSARSWYPRQLWTAHKWGDQALNQRCLQVGLGRYCIQHNKSWGENDCFLLQHKFYYTRFHYKNVIVLVVCLLHKQ